MNVSAVFIGERSSVLIESEGLRAGYLSVLICAVGGMRVCGFARVKSKL
jgi:hypothetical protein